MTRKRLLIALVAVIAVAMGVRAVIRAQTGAPPRAAGTGATPSVTSPRWVPVRSGAPNTARAVVYRFARAYGEVSSATVAERYRLLLSLAAPPLLSHLRAAGPGGELTVVSPTLRRTSIDSLLLKLQLTAPSGGAVHGTVVIQQWLVGPGTSGIPPMRSSYVVDLVQVGDDWRVSEFSLQP